MKKFLTGMLVLLMAITMVTPVLGAEKATVVSKPKSTTAIGTFDIDPGY
ncbi:hypothetical protein NDK47_18315 [Brevibacillus ruminantium]|uniref:Uncharacterized protein n=1 Tax=Brevibacillus ruminantium TaxID=2950604 RepID=A0ABY4WD68_9BACL|nr:hypothetical protein [Brevibacillus ruminantium]USG64103.1 hypothetical protein NDK47_18315 [Brevibacillus ruminantium]